MLCQLLTAETERVKHFSTYAAMGFTVLLIVYIGI